MKKHFHLLIDLFIHFSRKLSNHLDYFPSEFSLFSASNHVMYINCLCNVVSETVIVVRVSFQSEAQNHANTSRFLLNLLSW